MIIIAIIFGVAVVVGIALFWPVITYLVKEWRRGNIW